MCSLITRNILCNDCLKNLHNIIADATLWQPLTLQQDEVGMGGECYIEKIYAKFIYANPLRKMLHKFKYDKQLHLKWPLGYLINQLIQELDVKVDYIVPVPTHHIRRKERGYDHIQALLEYYIATSEIIPVKNNLVIKTIFYQRQVGLSKIQRGANIINSFKVVGDVTNKTVLLVDDVYTTGSTLNELAKTLKQAGASSIYACVLLRKIQNSTNNQ